MPTPGGLPKVGEVWELAIKLPGQPVEPRKFVVTKRTGGSYWALRVFSYSRGRELLVDPAFWLQSGWLKYVGEAGPKTREKLGLRKR
jgi:hypothetical protein